MNYDSVLSEIYDYSPFMSKGMEQAIEFYKDFIVNHGGKVLELGTATGLFTIPIARSGVEVTTVDISKEMLSYFYSKLEKEEASTKEKIIVHNQDMRELKLNEKFNVVMLPDNVLLIAKTLEEQLKVLKTAYDHLSSDGYLIFDVFTPNLELLFRKSEHSMCKFEIPNDKGYYLSHRYSKVEPLSQRISISFIHEKIGFDGNSQGRKYSEIYFRYMFPSEIILALKNVGFKVVNYLEDFNIKRKKVNYDTHQIFIAKK